MKVYLPRTLILILAVYLLPTRLPGWIGLGQSLAAENQVLLSSYCQVCHPGKVEEIQANGGQHRDAVDCTDCHREHPPSGTHAIPKCSMCHVASGNPHFGSPNCLNCHRPHSPLKIDLSKASRVRPACITCHPNQGDELLNYPSNHSVLDCKECHLQHGKYLSCLQCHSPHRTGQSYADCRECHRPHMPLKVAYKNNVPVKFCAPCHPKPSAQLAENRTKHHKFLCVYCHKFQHKVIPKCRTCHGEPHPAKLHQMHPQCIECHGGPHNLLN